MPAGRTIAIGDIHGCGHALSVLLSALDLKPEDTCVMLGDAIDRGFESRQVLEQLLALQAQCRLVPILGNHEQMLLDALDRRAPLHDWLCHGGAETLDSYGADFGVSDLPEEHIAFLRSWGDYHETSDHFFAHGNYVANKPLEKQPWHEMRWRSLNFFLPEPHCSGKTAIVGHTSNKQGRIVNRGYLVCIDTYCHGGGWLSALEPTTGKVWQCNRSGKLRETALPEVQ